MAQGGGAWRPRTFLLTDIVGSVAMWERDAELMSRAVARHDELIQSAVTAADGELVRRKGEGDSTFSVFARPAAALEAAVNVQCAVASEGWETDERVSIRAGVHTGDGEPRDGDWYGPAVNRAARLRGLAAGGQVLVSGVTAGLATEQLPRTSRLLYRGRKVLRGIERPEEVWELVAADDPRLAPDRRRLPGLPIALDRFVGRSDDLNGLVDLVADAPLVTLTGPGGSGKTRLATEVARLAEGRGVQVWVAYLSTIGDPGLLESVIGTSFGVGGDAEASLAELLEHPELVDGLLVLDNCEHLLEPSARLVLRLLASLPDLHVLATSREPLGVAGEHVWPVPPLVVPREKPASYRDLASVESMALLIDRVRLVRPELELNDDQTLALARVCRALDGLPLALELAAGRLRSMSISDLADRLDHQIELLTRRGPAIGDEARHRSLRLTLDWSYELLDAGQRGLARRLSVFAGGFRLDAAEAVCADSADLLDGIDELVAKSLVTFDTATARYRMLEPIRQYLRARLDEAEEVSAAAEAHALWTAGLCDRMGSGLFEHQRAYSVRLREETGNIDAALRWALDHGRGDVALRIVGSLGLFWFTNDQVTGRRWCATVVAGTPEGSPRRRAKALIAAGLVAQNDRDHSGAVDHLREALGLYRGLGSDAGVATTQFWLARALAQRGYGGDRPEDFRESHALFEDCLPAAERLGNVLLAAWCRLWLGIEALEADDLDRAEELCARIIADCHESGVLHPLGQTWRTLSDISYQRGDQPTAMRYLRQAVDVYRRLDDPWQLAGALLQLATTAGQDEGDEALLALAESAMLHDLIGPRPDRAVRLAGAAIVHSTRGDPSRAAAAVGAWDAHRGRASLGPQFDEALERTRHDLDAALIAAAVERAGRLSLDECIDEVILRPAGTGRPSPSR